MPMAESPDTVTFRVGAATVSMDRPAAQGLADRIDSGTVVSIDYEMVPDPGLTSIRVPSVAALRSALASVLS